MKNKIVISLILVIGIVGLLMMIKPTRGQQKQQEDDNVILDYEASKTKFKSKKRKERNKRFNHRGSSLTKRRIKEETVDSGTVRINHWWVGLSALPVKNSSAIVFGTVTGKEAHLSEDETNIYTEYEISIEKVYKDLSGSLQSGSVASFLRNGGTVRFKSGNTRKFSIRKKGVLKKNGRYLLFVNKVSDEDLFILTGYEFSGNKIIPLDNPNNKHPKSALPFDKYKNIDQKTLLQDLQNELQADSNNGGRK